MVLGKIDTMRKSKSRGRKLTIGTRKRGSKQTKQTYNKFNFICWAKSIALIEWPRTNSRLKELLLR